MNEYQFFATTPKGLELLLVDELRDLGAIHPMEKLAGVTFTGDLKIAYKACLWSRLANRILLRLTSIPAETPEELYTGVQTIQWDEHLCPNGTLHINFTTSHSNITHSLFGAQKVKDAIVDQFREKYQARPSVGREQADINIHVYLHRNIATLSLDLSGESLHKRGYRLEKGIAPLKENLAAAILQRSGWKSLAEKNGSLLDPMCGSGTFLIEGAWIAANIAPGLIRQYYGFLGWKNHDSKLWDELVKEAEEIRDRGIENLPSIIGYDKDPNAIKIAFANIERAKLHGKIHVEKRDLTAFSSNKPSGLVVVNPPYGERLGEIQELQKLYSTLGTQLKQHFIGWKAAVLTGNAELGKVMGLRARKHYALFNGAIPCQLLLFDVNPEYFVDRSPSANNERRIRYAQKQLSEEDRKMAQMFANRIQKNIKNLRRFRDEENLNCYRIYDADLPEYAVAIDFYNDFVCVQEYPPPKNVDKNKADKRLKQILAVLPDALDCPAANVFLRESSTLESFNQVQEQDLHFLINLQDGNRETGLPLEQRKLRALIRKTVSGKTFLNLFSHSGSMTVVAAKAGAHITRSVSENLFYCDWTKRNMELNQLTGQFIAEEISKWVSKEKLRYDMIFMDLPWGKFHLREEYPELIDKVVKLLTKLGELYIVTQDDRFKLSPHLMQNYHITDITSQILPKDFARNPKIQQCFVVRPI